MKLREYLDRERLTNAAFAKQTGLPPESIRLYALGKAIPRRKAMEAILKATAGEVKPADFYTEHAGAAA